MKYQRLIFLVFILFYFSQFGFSQIPSKGIVIDEIKKVAISNATFFVKKVEHQDTSIVEFGFTNESGRFSLINPVKEPAMILVEINHVAYQSKLIRLNEIPIISNELILSIQEKVQELQEVIVTENRRIEILGDTTIFKVNAFKMGNERKLEEVLKNLPGMEVDETSGALKFKGKEVEEVQIQGDDLMGQNYGLLTKNLSIDLVKSIQAIENYHSNPLLKEMGKSSKVALNLELTNLAKAIFGEGQASLGGGGKIRQEVNLQLIVLLKKMKNFFNVQTNNVGLNPAGIDLIQSSRIRNFNDDFSTKNTDYLDDNFQKSLPEHNQSQENSQKSIISGNIWKPDSLSQLKLQLNVLGDKFSNQESSTMVSNLASNSFSYTDSQRGIKSPFLGYINLSYKKYISTKKLLETNLFLQYGSGNTRKVFQRNLLQTQENLANWNLGTQQIKANYTEKLPFGILQTSTVLGADFQQQFFQQPLIGELFSTTLDSNFIESTQALRSSSQVFFQKVQLMIPKDWLKWSGSINYLNQKNKFLSDISTNQSFTSYNPNEFELLSSKFSQNNQFKIELENFSLQYQLGLVWLNYQLIDPNITKKQAFFLKNDLILTYKFNNKSTFLLSYNNNKDIPQDLPYFKNPLFTDGRNYKTNLSSLDLVENQNIFAIYRLDQLLEGISHVFQLNYGTSYNGYFNKINFGNQFFETINFQKNVSTSQFAMVYQFNKYFFVPRLQVNLMTNFQSGNGYTEFLNAGFSKTKNSNYGYSLKLQNKPIAQLSLEYEIGMDWSEINNPFNSGKNTILRQKGLINYQFNSLINSSLTYQIINPSNSSLNKQFYFCDLQLNYLKPIKNQFQIGLAIKNIFNNNQIIQVENSIYGNSTREIQLIPRICQVNVLFKI